MPQLLFTNLATASALCNAFLLHASRDLGYPELCFDIAEGLMRPVPLPWSEPKRPDAHPSERRPKRVVWPRSVSPASGEMG